MTHRKISGPRGRQPGLHVYKDTIRGRNWQHCDGCGRTVRGAYIWIEEWAEHESKRTATCRLLHPKCWQIEKHGGAE